MLSIHRGATGHSERHERRRVETRGQSAEWALVHLLGIANAAGRIALRARSKNAQITQSLPSALNRLTRLGLSGVLGRGGLVTRG